MATIQLLTIGYYVFIFTSIATLPIYAFASKPVRSVNTLTPTTASSSEVICLQRPHPPRTPLEALQSLVENSRNLPQLDRKDGRDVYGDFDESTADSYLRSFEAEIADEFGVEDALFVPSGVMAQSIALKIHTKERKKQVSHSSGPASVLLHATSHLLLHEEDAFREVCGLEAIVLPRENQLGLGFGGVPLYFQDVNSFWKTQAMDHNSTIVALVLELPHRELGGKLTPWEDILKLRNFTKQNGIAFHCDGARIFEASTGYQKSLAEMAAVFDTMYISFYKGLGGLSGAMLLGSKAFCEDARIWLRRMGGNLYTVLPYAASAWSGFRRYWVLADDLQNGGATPSTREHMTFQDKKEKLVRLVRTLSANAEISRALRFEPSIPQVNMVHGYLKFPMCDCEKARDQVIKELGIAVFNRWKPIRVEDDPKAYSEGLTGKFEISIGESNGLVSVSRVARSTWPSGKKTHLVNQSCLLSPDMLSVPSLGVILRSRAKSMEGLHIKHFDARVVVTDPLVQSFYSAVAEEKVQSFLEEEAGLWWFPIFEDSRWRDTFEGVSCSRINRSCGQFRMWVANYSPATNYRGWKGYRGSSVRQHRYPYKSGIS